LWPDQRLTPAAGRYVGYKHTAADLVLFLDGDMALYPGWAEKACRTLQDYPDVAVVTGLLIELPKTAGVGSPSPVSGTAEGNLVAADVRHGGGAALYRRSVLEEVGTFTPDLYSDEEPELCIRIRSQGYRVLELQHPIAYHYSNPDKAISTLVGRWRRNLFLGYGQIIRYHFGDKFLWAYLKERGYALLPLVGIVAGAMSFLWSASSHNWLWFGVWLLSLGSILTYDAYRKRSLQAMIYSLLQRLAIIDGTVRGLLLRPLDPNEYLHKLQVLKDTGFYFPHAQLDHLDRI
jgi:cellulose synthase/poly-beta-1,6-N-acetylglucosamine synthase-like glycosyltransferase